MIYINETMRISKLDDKNLQLEILKPTTNRKTGETSSEWQWAGYYTHLEGALLGAFRKLIDSNVEAGTPLQNLAEQIHKAERTIVDKFADI